MYQPLYNEALCFGSERVTKTSMHVEAAGTFRMYRRITGSYPASTAAAVFYVQQLGFEISDEKTNMVSLHGRHINLFIERGPALGPVFESLLTMLSTPSSGS